MSLYIDITMHKETSCEYIATEIIKAMKTYLDINSVDDIQVLMKDHNRVKLEIMNEELIQWMCIEEENILADLHIMLNEFASVSIDTSERECGYTWSCNNMQSGIIAMCN